MIEPYDPYKAVQPAYSQQPQSPPPYYETASVPPTIQPFWIGQEFFVAPDVVQVSGQPVTIAGTSWRFNDQYAYQTRTATATFVAAILLAPCTGLLSLLLLLIKERYISGFVTVEVQSQMMTFTSRVWVEDFPAIDAVRKATEQAQRWSIAAWQARQ